ncbi:MAG: thiamine pyrophosphate-binding protein, partial [Patescibacteria group bacterium]
DATSGVTFPSFRKIAGAFSLPYLAIRNNKGVVLGITKALKISGPVICEIFMDPNQELNPRPKNVIHPDGTFTIPPLEDMYPFLDREEFKQNIV